LQKFRAPASQHASTHFDFVVQSRMIEDVHHRMDRACFVIISAINKTPNPRMRNGAGTHRARLDSYVQIAFSQAVISDSSAGLA
jgi:hypothetical protein